MPATRRGAGTFADRAEAGQELAQWFLGARPGGDLLVLALPRGGVPVACEVAAALCAPLDVFLVRKLGAPLNPELAVGAVASGGVTVYNRDVLASLGLGEDDLTDVRRREQAELARRERRYRDRAPPDLKGRTVMLVDDGIATGATMRAAVEAVRLAGPAAVIVAAPTASAEAVQQLERIADAVVVLEVPEPYIAVGARYRNFPQLSDDEVVALLARARAAQP